MRAILKHFNTLGDLNEYTKNPSDQALFSSSTKGATNVFVFGSDFTSGKECNIIQKGEREILERDFGTRYSVLLELVYFDPIRMTALDPMHNLFLGTAKHKIYVRKTHKVSFKNFSFTFLYNVALFPMTHYPY
jgi:hypothetical protein